MADFMRMKYENPKLKQSEIANRLGYSSSTLQRNRIDINMFSPHRIQSNNTIKRAKKASNTNFNKDSYTSDDVKRPQMISKDLKPTSNNRPVQNEKKNKVKGGANSEIKEHYLDEILNSNNSSRD